MSMLKESPTLLATAATACVAVVAMIPGPNIIVLMIVMLPLWFIDDLGYIDLGSQSHGFFIPNGLGWLFAVVPFWLFWFWIGVNTKKHLERSKASPK